VPSDALRILYEDDACLVAFKPAGLATQAPREFDSLERQVRAMLERRAAAKSRAAEPTGARPVYLGLPHRLDRAVSGVIVLAKTRRAARKLSRQFERREVRKIYWACVAGAVEPASGTWTDSLRKVPDEPRAEIVAADHPDAQIAVLHYRTLGDITQHASAGTLLEIELETGRMHQIRLQATARGHAVWGDAMYGSQIPFGPPTDDPRQRIIAVHARSLEFKHPDSGEQLSITAPLPDEWQNLGLPVEPQPSERVSPR
jgi:23S rRNA pseudouridine1911/1915/1917 synthase